MGGKTPFVVGDRVGRLILLERISEKYKVTKWLCQCECGNTSIIRQACLVTGDSKSCGCYKREESRKRMTKHGLSYDGTRGLNSYAHMLRRCYAPEEPFYEDYGGRGISVCDRWNPQKGGSFENFLKDMGERPSKEYSLERINVNGDYSPDNCKWGTQREQNFNKRKQSNNTSGRTGVSRKKDVNKWYASIVVDGVYYYLGQYFTFEEACLAREEAETLHYGEVRPEARETEYAI